MPAATTVNITNRSQFTAYFDLYAESSSFEDFYGQNNTNYHTLVTDYALPVGTQITMLDFGSQSGTPEYYYYTVDDLSYQSALQQLQSENEICYRLSDFIKMGSTSSDNTYDDKKANRTYYDEIQKRTIEEFIFIFDFKETSIIGDYLNKYIRFELRNEEDRALVTVLGIRHTLMYFNLYESSNMVLNQNVSLENYYIYPDMQRDISYETMITYDQTSNRESIINTNYESTSMGLNITLYDQSGNQVSSSLLTGTSIRMDGVEYFADSEGVFRIKLAGKVSNLKKSLYLLADENLPPGNYEVVFTLFASSDGLHNSGSLQYTENSIHITVVPADNAIAVTSEDVMKVIDGDTGLNEEGSRQSNYQIVAIQSLENPNLRVSLYKRNITDQYDKSFSEISMNEVFSNTFESPSSYGLTTSSLYEVMVSNDVTSQFDFKVEYNDLLTSGTYKIVFRLYDNNQLIDEDFESPDIMHDARTITITTTEAGQLASVLEEYQDVKVLKIVGPISSTDLKAIEDLLEKRGGTNEEPVDAPLEVLDLSDATGLTTNVVISPDGSGSVYRNYTLKKITLPEGITSIGRWGFAGFCALEEINIPSTVTSLGHSAFRMCEKLETITIPEGITSIPSNCFWRCGSLRECNIPESVERIESGAFSFTSLEGSLVFGENLEYIGGSAFYRTNISSIDMSKTKITSICEVSGDMNAFADCSNLTSLVLPNTITSIGTTAFSSSPIGIIDLPAFCADVFIRSVKNHTRGICIAVRRTRHLLPKKSVAQLADFHGCFQTFTQNSGRVQKPVSGGDINR